MFDYEKFENLVNKAKKTYVQRHAYPFAYFDNLFDEKLIDKINEEIDTTDFQKDVRAINDIEVKTRSNFEDNEDLPLAIRRAFEIINGGRFLKIISKLTSIEGLISDPYHDGGGVNIIENGGTLAVHVDGTHQNRMKICRRINAILFLNKKWDINWNGYHEQWDYSKKNLSPFDPNQEWHCVRKILPICNRLYIFTTNDQSWHGHAGILNVPEDVRRKSLIAYYYTATRPEQDLSFDSPHRALFIKNSQTLTEKAFDKTEVCL